VWNSKLLSFVWLKKHFLAIKKTDSYYQNRFSDFKMKIINSREVDVDRKYIYIETRILLIFAVDHDPPKYV
jgi:hypothetical protein